MSLINLMNKEFEICHLYPKHMSLYGDRGNIFSLLYRAKARNINASVQFCGLGERISPSAKLIMLGGGQDSDQERIIPDLLSKRNELRDLIYSGAVFLGICGGYQLLGNYYETTTETIDGLGLLNIYTKRAKNKEKRIIGNMKAFSEKFGHMWGFENHGGRTYINDLEPLGKVLQGGGNNGQDKTEGVLAELEEGLVIGSYLHSFLPRNSKVTDFLIAKALKIQIEELLPLDDQIENENEKNGLSLAY